MLLLVHFVIHGKQNLRLMRLCLLQMSKICCLVCWSTIFPFTKCLPLQCTVPMLVGSGLKENKRRKVETLFKNCGNICHSQVACFKINFGDKAVFWKVYGCLQVYAIECFHPNLSIFDIYIVMFQEPAQISVAVLNSHSIIWCCVNQPTICIKPLNE